MSTGLMTLAGTLNTVAKINGGIGTNLGSLLVGASGLIDVGSGGTYQTNGDLSGPNNVGGRIRVAGLFENDPISGGNTRTFLPVDLESGGTVASNGGEMQLRWGGVWSGGTLDTTTSSTDDASIVLLGEGDAFQITGDVTITNSGLGPLNSVFLGPGFGAQPMIAIDGSLTVDNAIASIRAPSITGSGTITNRGVLTTQRTTTIEPRVFNEAGMAFNASTTVDGGLVNTGTVEQRNNVFLGASDGVLNNGTWEIESSSRLDSVLGNEPLLETFVNSGTLRGDSPLNFTATVRFDNGGTVIADSGAFLHFTNATTLTTNPDGTTGQAIRGSWRSINTGQITFDPPPTQIGPAESTPDEQHKIDGDGDSTPWLEGVKRMKDTDATIGDTVFDETLKLEKSKLTIEEDAEVELPGIDADESDIELKPGSRLRATGPESSRIGRPGAKRGSKVLLPPSVQLELTRPVELPSVIDQLQGVISQARPRSGTPAPPLVRAPLVIVQGIITPASGGLGSMTIDGDLEMGPGAELRVDTDGPGLTDRLDVTGTAAVNGTVVLAIDGAFLPEIGDEVIVMTAAGGFTGAIAAVDAPPVDGVRWRARVVGTELRVLAACPADLATPFGVLDLSDINAFVAGFLSQHPDADLTGDGVFDLSDITAFVGFFNGGC